MDRIILNMAKLAAKTKDYELIGYVKELIEKYADTVNCPEGWRRVGKSLEELFKSDSWIYEQLELWNYE